MTANEILIDLWHHGIDVRLTQDHQNLVVPAGRLTPEQRAQVLDHKPALIKLLTDAAATTAQLLAAAMQVCDRHGDAEPARQEMRAECLALPPHLQADALAHFQQTYGAKND